MAAYAALVSLMNTMKQIQNHPQLPICFDQKEIEPLSEKVRFLQGFMECDSHGSSKEEVEVLESEIASAAHAAEDVIESHVADQILAEKSSKESRSRILLDLQRVIEDMDTIQEKVIMKVEEEGGFNPLKKRKKMEGGFKDLQPFPMAATSSRPLTTGKTTMVGFDGYLFQLMDVLIGHQSSRQIIPIVGMGGIGKTTLARNAFENSLITHHFDIRAWATISQNYNVREIFLQLLPSQAENRESFLAMDQRQLGEELYKRLWGRRYLIILDDIWGIEAWDNLKFSFPDNGNGSCIVVTTRLKEVALHFGSSYLAIDFLDEVQSWDLFCRNAFGQEGCPIELEEVGKMIAKNCKGLPLSIVVTGGFLRNSSKSQEFWENVAKDTNSILNSEGEEQCLDILSLSYSHLPVHLKPCFLYMGVFPEDDEIRVSRLIKLWVAEGFLKPNEGQSLEEGAEDYLKDLIDRNLILVHSWGSNGKIKACNIHDLIRELCLKVAEKEKFLYVMKSLDTPRAMNRERRIVIHENVPDHIIFHALESASLVRSLICKGRRRFNFRLLRVLIAVDEGFVESDSLCVNLRCIDRRFVWYVDDQVTRSRQFIPFLYLPRKLSLFWNLQTISIKGCQEQHFARHEIWEMPQLRHLNVDILYLYDPPLSDRVDLVLQNLQTLGTVQNFRLSEEACKRIPNIKKLSIVYDVLPQKCEACLYYCPHNVGRLRKLRSLNLCFTQMSYWHDLLLNMTFPSSLQKLTLFGCRLYWKDLSTIGSLPNLEVLKLDNDSVRGHEWNPVEGEFLGLKFLKISGCSELIYWNVDSFHFPVLENLVLEYLTELDEIPSGIGEISTLRSIRLEHCSMSCSISAVEILVEQENLGNEDLQLEVQFALEAYMVRFKERLEQEGFTSNNLHLK